MKFGKQLQLGIYEPWREYYIQYNKLKRVINRRKFIADKESELTSANVKDSSAPSSRTAAKSGKLAKGLAADDSDEETIPLVPDKKGKESYQSINNANCKGNFDESIDFFPFIVEEINKINNFFVGKLASLRISLNEIVEERQNTYRTHHTSSDSSYLLRLRDIYVELAALRSYCDLNKTGFSKIIKKYDKVMGEKNLEQWTKTIDRQTFTTSQEPIKMMDIVTGFVSRDKLIEWERFATEQQNKASDDIFTAIRPIGLFVSLCTFILSLAIPTIIPNDSAASRCMSLLLFVIFLWITEAIPYFATAILIPILVTTMGVLKDPSDPEKLMSPEAAATFVTDHIFNHTTFLLLGGYTLSTAFSRCQLELRIASMLQNRLGSNPNYFILAIMFLGLFLSMWISNHTAPILCATIILPIVRDLPTDSKFSKALLLGLAYACNFGGMMTPISSLQNVLAVSYLEQVGASISFGRWLLISVPFCTVCTFVAWLLIIVVVQPNDVISIPVIVYERSNAFGRKNLTIMILSLVTLFLFALFQNFKFIFGDISIISLSFVIVMFGTGILSEVDFNSMSWHTLILVGGGNVLGKAIASSGLLGYLSDAITAVLPLTSPFLALICVLFFCCAVATFVSHTVASLILMPIITSIALSLDLAEPMVIGSAFAISAAMGLPFSSFPNVNSLLIVDDFQRPYLSVQDFLKSGMMITAIAIVLIATFGAWMLLRRIVGSNVIDS